MNGERRLIFGFLLLVIGPFLMLTDAGLILGILFLLGGVYLFLTGLVASGIPRAVHTWRDLPGLIIPPSPPKALTPVPAASPPTESSPPSTSEPASPGKFCPACGEQNTRSAAFCKKCGKPLPPPS